MTIRLNETILHAPDEPTPFTIYFDVSVKLEVGKKVITGSLEVFTETDEMCRVNGEVSTMKALEILLNNCRIGRVDIFKSRFIGKFTLTNLLSFAPSANDSRV